MTPIEELLETTLSRAASTVAPSSGLAEGSIRTARRIRTRRRAAAVGAVAACAAVVVAIASLAGSTKNHEEQPIQSPTVSSTPTDASSVAPARLPMDQLLQQLQVIWAGDLTIHNGGQSIDLHPVPRGANSIQFVVPLSGGGYAVQILTSTGASVVALVDKSGRVQSLGPDGMSNGLSYVVGSADGKTIAYNLVRGKHSEIRLIDTSGRLLQRKTFNALYRPLAFDATQVWLVSQEPGAPLAPMIWDRTTGKTTPINLGSETYVTAVDLVHGRAALETAKCPLQLVAVSAPEHVLAKRCSSVAMSFSPDGATLVGRAIDVPKVGVDLELLSAKDLRPRQTFRIQIKTFIFAWSATDKWVTLDTADRAAELDVTTGKATYFLTESQQNPLPRLAPVS